MKNVLNHSSTGLIILFQILLSSTFNIQGQSNLTISSPDQNIKVQVTLKNKIYYSVFYKDKMIIAPSAISMNINNGTILGQDPQLASQQTKSVSVAIPTVYGKRSLLPDIYNELQLDFNGNFSVYVRAYNEGVAYRFITRLKDNMNVTDEEVSFKFTENHRILAPLAGDFQTSFEHVREWVNILDLNDNNFAYCPVIVAIDDNLKIAITESDVRDYPGMYIYHKPNNSHLLINGLFPAYPVKTEQGGWGLFNMRVTERADYIAKTQGTRSFPWRVMVITDEDEVLADNNMVYKLASPCELKETVWIKPGKVCWEWWNDWNLEGVDFKTGINNQTYEYYIDFASENGLEYMLFDEGWSDQFDLTLPNPQLDMEHLFRYAKEKNVKIILWCVWHTLDRQMDKAFTQFEKWGVAGVKVDFIDRDDQMAINFYERCGREAAKHKLLVDFHGCSKPTGLSRTYPNIINYEGVIGNEYNKGNWGGKFPTPEHNVTIAFTRMMAGPMDYTPGAMRNSTQTSFGFSNSTPMSRGTRCHQLGMYLVYDAPLQMLCDAPTEYMKHPDILLFLSDVPVNWDETIVLDAVLTDYVLTARKKDNQWYVGAMTDWTEREITVDFSFLSPGTWKAEIFRDGINANRLANDYIREVLDISNSSKLKIRLAEGGGMVLRAYQEN